MLFHNQLIRDFQSLTVDASSSTAGASVYEKALEMKELSDSLAIVKKLFSLMEAGNNTVQGLTPWILDIKTQITTVEKVTDNFLGVLEPHLPKDTGGRRLVGQDTEFEVDQGDKHWEKIAGNFQGGKYGFGSKRKYRLWKNQNIKQHPNLRHVFATMEDLDTEKFESVHERALKMQGNLHSSLNKHAEKGSRRKLNVELIGRYMLCSIDELASIIYPVMGF